MLLSPCRNFSDVPVSSERPDTDKVRNEVEIEQEDTRVYAYIEVAPVVEWKGDVCYGD